MEFEVKISGSGTKAQIIESLEAIVKSMENDLKETKNTFEDETLCAEINPV